MAQFNIRRYREADRDRLHKVMHRSLRAVDQVFEDIPIDTDQSYIEKFIQSGGELLVGEVNDLIIATGGFRPFEGSISEFLNVNRDSVVEIKRLYVLPEYQRLGYGQQILNELENIARSQGRSMIVAEVFDIQERAISFYNTAGYSNIYEENKYYSGNCIKVRYFKKPFVNR